jgi:1-acyl-sn-glycerol-3-phosphate acyltransferase
MTVMAVVLARIPADPLPAGVVLGVHAFLQVPHAAAVLASYALIGLFGGLYIVPLYAMLQTRGDARAVARVIAANNILNAIFIVASALFAIALYKLGLTMTQLFLAVALLNAIVAAYIFFLVPEFLLRFVVWVLINTFYRLRIEGLRNVPRSQAALLVCNHVSYIDALVIGSVLPRLPRFITDHLVYNAPGLGALMRLGRAIPIAQSREDPALKEAAFDAAAQALREGELVMIFPEGTLTRDGEFRPFRSGVEEILKRHPVPVIPMALRGLWGSFFSRAEAGRAMVRPFRRGVFNRVELIVGAPVAPELATADALQSQVAALRGSWR